MGPREDIGRARERFFRRPGSPPLREREMNQTEKATAKDILEEGLRYLPDAEVLQRQGRPEREIVNGAAEWHAELLIICTRAQCGGNGKQGLIKKMGNTRPPAFRFPPHNNNL